MDVSPKWWIKIRTSEESIKKYVYEKFERDYYPRIILQGSRKIDLDITGFPIKRQIMDNLKCGTFDYEFLPEDESLKESYFITNGNVYYRPRRLKTNSRLLIKFEM